MKKIVVTKWQEDVFEGRFEGRSGHDIGPMSEVALWKFVLTNAAELGIEVEYVNPHENEGEKKT